MFKNQQKKTVSLTASFLLPHKDIKNTQEIGHEHLNKNAGSYSLEMQV